MVTPDGFALSAEGCQVSIACEHQVAEKPQQENILRQLSRLGGTPFECSGVDLPAGFNYFIPSSKFSGKNNTASFRCSISDCVSSAIYPTLCLEKRTQ